MYASFSLSPSLSSQLNVFYRRTTHFNNKIQSRNSSLDIHTTRLQHPRTQSSASWCLPGLKLHLLSLFTNIVTETTNFLLAFISHSPTRPLTAGRNQPLTLSVPHRVVGLRTLSHWPAPHRPLFAQNSLRDAGAYGW